MHPPVSAEKKEAMRQLREFLPPTYARLATIGGLHVTTVREIASKENWPRHSFTRDTVMQPASRREQIAQAAAQARAQALEAINRPADNVPPGDVSALLVAELRAVLAAMQGGVIDKPRIDALVTAIKLAEQLQKMPNGLGGGAGHNEDQTRSDDELAAILARVDRRIVELARDYAERLVAGEFDAAPG